LGELIAAIDDSGQFEYIAVVMGDKQSINNNGKKLPSNFTHMNRMPKKEKVPLLRSFNFNENIYVCCMHIDLLNLRKSIDAYSTKIRKRKIKRNISAIVGYEIKLALQDNFRDIILNSKCTINDIVFQVDNDILREYLGYSGLQSTTPDIAHKLADCVAHSNFHKYNVENIKECGKNFKRDFHQKVMQQVMHE
jgi:hypothetical protein